MTRIERIIFWLTTIVVAITRWPALSRTLWDWDEALFALAMRDYDVRLYHPHPPGFPLFIALAKLIPHADEFHALQTIVFVASLFVFPAAFFLARAVRASFFVAIAAGLLLSFMPNVWFYGGTALSDVPSMVLSLAACALLLRGRILEGAIVLGIAAGFRPQNLLIALVPFALAFRARWRTALLGALITATIVAVTYGAAASLSGGWSEYRDTLAHHERYIRETDSFLSPIRPPLWKVADDFFFWPYRAPLINGIVTLLVIVALVRRRAHVLLALAIFGPFCLFAWLYLDFHSVSRFSIAYMPLFAMLAADGIDALRRAREAALAIVVAMMIVWTWPALRIVHTTASPPVAAIEWIRAHGRSVIDVDERLGAHAGLLLADYERSDRGMQLREGPGKITFTRDRARLASIARDRYFEVSVTPR